MNKQLHNLNLITAQNVHIFAFTCTTQNYVKTFHLFFSS